MTFPIRYESLVDRARTRGQLEPEDVDIADTEAAEKALEQLRQTLTLIDQSGVADPYTSLRFAVDALDECRLDSLFYTLHLAREHLDRQVARELEDEEQREALEIAGEKLCTLLDAGLGAELDAETFELHEIRNAMADVRMRIRQTEIEARKRARAAEHGWGGEIKKQRRRGR